MCQDDYEHKVVEARPDVLRYATKLAGGRKQDADDLVQDTIYLALKYRERYRDQNTIQAWLITICANIYRNNLKRGRKVTTEARIREQATAQNHESVNVYIDSLPEEQQATMRMLVEGYKYKEIAYRLATPIGTIKSRINKARKELLKYVRA